MFELILTDRLGRCSTCSHQQTIVDLCGRLADQTDSHIKKTRAYSAEVRRQLGVNGCAQMRVDRPADGEEIRVDFPEMCNASPDVSQDKVQEIMIWATKQVTGEQASRRRSLFTMA